MFKLESLFSGLVIFITQVFKDNILTTCNFYTFAKFIIYVTKFSENLSAFLLKKYD